MFSLNRSILTVSRACLMPSLPGLLMADINAYNKSITTVGLKQTDDNIFVIVAVVNSSLKSLEENRLFANIMTPPQQTLCKVGKSFISAGFELPKNYPDKSLRLVTYDKNKPLLSDSNFKQSYYINVLQKPSKNPQKCTSRLRHRGACKPKKQQVTRILSGYY